MPRSLFDPRVVLLTSCLAIWSAGPVAAQAFEDDFARPDGAPDGWEANAGSWSIVGGALEAGPAAGGGQAGEQQIFAGDPAMDLPEDIVLSFSWEFLAPADSQPVGRHAGCYFAWNTPGIRWDAATTGYQLHWIDREADRGLNLLRWDGAGFVALWAGTFDAFLDPPETVEVEIEGPTIRVFGDGIFAFEVDDETYRGGKAGLWTWDGAGQHVRFDDVVIEGEFAPVTACFGTSSLVARVDEVITFDGTCSSGRASPITAWEWDFGDGDTATGEVVDHAYAFPDVYVVSLTVRNAAGDTDTIEMEIAVADSVCPFEDDFDRADGPIDRDGWSLSPTTPGQWDIEGNRLHAVSAGEGQLWRGVPPGLCLGDQVTIEFTIEFVGHAGCNPGPVGKHAGIHFFAQDATARGSTTTYGLWWIDRDADFGMGLHRWGGGLTQLQNSKDTAPDLCEPPSRWTITVDGPEIKCYGDGRLILDVVDDVIPRSGAIGPWVYSNEQDVYFDDFSVRAGVFPPELDESIACARASDGAVAAGDVVTFDASCSQIAAGANVTAWEWDFGDGTTGTGETVEHAYAFSGAYVVELTVRLSVGPAVTTQLSVSVSEAATLPFTETFDGAPGPDVPGWTPFGGDWEITADGRLRGRSGGDEAQGEAYIWIGDPPIRFSGDLTIEFRIEFQNWLGDQGGQVGKHAGLFFFADEPIIRWSNDAYDIWWIDRTQDFGLGLHDWTNGVLSFLSPGTGIELPQLDVLDPPEVWRVEIDGDTIRVYGDDELLVERVDGARRDGYIGFWAYSNDQDVVFDDVCIVRGPFEGSPDCIERTVVPCFAGGEGTYAPGETVAFDAGCTTTDGGVTVTEYRWDFGDGETATGRTAQHAWAARGEFTVVLTAVPSAGEPQRTSRRVVVEETGALPIEETFDDGLDDWTVASGAWDASEGELVVETAGQEAHIWYGDPPLPLEGDLHIEFDVRFEAHDPPDDPIGKHAGVFFHARDAAPRFQSASYDVWWIDRAQDLGMGLHRWQDGALTFLSPGTFDLFAGPPEHWEIIVEGETITVLGDGELVAEVVDETRRFGYFGFWAYSNNQRVVFDDLCIRRPGDVCESPPPVRFERGDADGSGTINITDAINILNFLFLGGAAPPCLDAADVDDSGVVNITDGINLLNFLFLGGAAPRAPHGFCGGDPTDGDGLDCAEETCFE